MKKTLSLILSLILVFTLAVPAFAEASESELNVIVANDIHYNERYSHVASVAKRNSINETYAHIASTGRLVYESAATTKAFFDEAASFLPKNLLKNSTSLSKDGNYFLVTFKRKYLH